MVFCGALKRAPQIHWGTKEVSSENGHIPLGERGHDLGLVDEEGRVEAAALQVLPHQLVQQPRCALRGRALHALRLTLHQLSCVEEQ